MDKFLENQFWMVEGVDPHYFETFFTVRVEFNNGRVIGFDAAKPEAKLDLNKIDEKLALLKVSPIGSKIDGVGWRRRENLFYLRIYERDLLK